MSATMVLLASLPNQRQGAKSGVDEQESLASHMFRPKIVAQDEVDLEESRVPSR